MNINDKDQDISGNNDEENLGKEKVSLDAIIQDDILDEDLDEIVSKTVELNDIIKERDDLNDRLMRSLADAENLRKRTDRDRRDTEIYAVTKMARDLLSVYDNLQRALELVDSQLDESALPMIEGIELTQRELLTIFTKHKIEQIEPGLGDRFDPKLHQAMFEAPSEKLEKGEILQVMTNGFVIGDRLLRAAQVGVSSGAPVLEPDVGKT
jgi:molecular chaperone GrpE